MTTPNPFRPNKPVVPGMFAGRQLEIQGISSTLDQTRVGNAGHVLVVGERGIGKSSLVLAAQAYASMGVDGGNGCNFLVVPVTVTGSDTEAVIARRIALKVQQRLGPVKRLTNVQNLIKETWALIQRVEVAGTKISPGEQISEALDVADRLVAALQATLEIIDGAFDGILITIDEADTAGRAFGSLMKRTVDGLGAAENDRVCFVLAGLPELPELMKAGHASSLRAFKAFTLGPLKSGERKEVVERCAYDAGSSADHSARVLAGDCADQTDLSDSQSKGRTCASSRVRRPRVTTAPLGDNAVVAVACR